MRRTRPEPEQQTGMKLKSIIFILFALALTAVSASSCMLGFLDAGLNGEEGTLIICGLVVDKDDNKPLKGIEMTFQCSEEGIGKITVHTDEKGMYNIECQGLTEAVGGYVSARDSEGRYRDSTREIVVMWIGDEFNAQTNTFFLNDCNFALQRK